MTGEPPPTPTRLARIWLAVALLAILGAAAAGTVATLPVHNTGWKSTQRASVQPREPQGTPLGDYEYSVISRQEIVPTFAAVVASGHVVDTAAHALRVDPHSIVVATTTTPNTALMTISVQAASRRVASSMAALILRDGAAFVTQLAIPYRIVPVPAGAQLGSATGWKLQPLLALAAIWSTAAILAVWVILRMRRSRHYPTSW